MKKANTINLMVLHMLSNKIICLSTITIVEGFFRRTDINTLLSLQDVKSANLHSSGEIIGEFETKPNNNSRVVLYKNSVSMTPEGQDDINLTTIEATLEVVYSSDTKVTKKEFTDHIKNNIKKDAWGTWVKFISDSCNKMNIPNIPIKE